MMWAISWASTEASSLSASDVRIRPELTPMYPPGPAKAFICGSVSHEEVKSLRGVIAVGREFLTDGLNVISDLRVFVDFELTMKTAQESLAQFLLLQWGNHGSCGIADFEQCNGVLIRSKEVDVESCSEGRVLIDFPGNSMSSRF
ncbi:MAG: hypothetical protein MZW92_16660 [Comamonadaceae bacterium]|nr:hypothetical protein [Comamonadaceae bacterium]